MTEAALPDAAAPAVTAALLVVGDEILSGRTKDKNIGYIAEYLTNIGVELCEVRVVPDIAAEIVAAITALSARYTYLFTTGGIGPTHDDITADCVAAAFGVELPIDPRAVAVMRERYAEGELNAARLRMARIPVGAELIANPVSKAPGFQIGNVIVMAGVPAVMQAMLDDVAPRLAVGRKMLSHTLDAAGLPEGIYADGLGAIAGRHPEVSIGSYPAFTGQGFRNQIVVRGKDATLIAAVVVEISAFLAGLAPDGAPA